MRANRPRFVFGLVAGPVVLLAVPSRDVPTEPSDEILVPAPPSYSPDPAAPTIHPLPDGGVFSVPLLRYGYHACRASQDRTVLHASRRGMRSPLNREFVAHGRRGRGHRVVLLG